MLGFCILILLQLLRLAALCGAHWCVLHNISSGDRFFKYLHCFFPFGTDGDHSRHTQAIASVPKLKGPERCLGFAFSSYWQLLRLAALCTAHWCVFHKILSGDSFFKYLHLLKCNCAMILRVKPIYFPKPAFECAAACLYFPNGTSSAPSTTEDFFCPVGEYRAACSSSCHIFLRIGKKGLQLCS